jgi:chemotaxis protein MotA
MVVVVWGALLVTGFTQYDVIPADYQFLNLPSLAIVFGGICASVFISYPFRSVLKAFAQSTKLFSHSTITDEVLEADAQRILEWQKMLKMNRNAALNRLSEEYANSFEGYIFSIMDTNYTLEELRELGEINIEENYSRQKQVNQIIFSMGKVSPVFGMFGTLFGLIVILSGFSEVESLLTGLGAALMTTLYGIVIGNFIFTPMARKMDNISSMQYFREKLILEGVLLIEQQKTSLQIYDKLQAHMRRNSFQR